MIKLGRLRLDNFKSFENPFVIDMTDVNLLILDGPNGFGKTTLFDAIELCFTGKISRLVSTDGKVKKQHLLKHNDSRPTSVFLELMTEEASTVVYAHIPASVSNNEKKVSNLSIKISLLKAWPSSFDSEANFIFDKNQSLPNLISNENLQSTFNIFNYVQQEDACHFLKNKEVDRHNKISFLFGTEHKHEEKEKINLIKDQLSSKIDSIRDEIQEKNTIIDIIRGELLGIQLYEGEIKHSVIEKIPLIYNIHNKSLANLSRQSLKTISSDLDNLLRIQSNPNAFDLAEFNHKANILTNDSTGIIDDIIVAGYITDYEDILKLRKHLLWIEQLEKKLENHRRVSRYIDKDHNVPFTEQLEDIAYLYPYRHAVFEKKLAKHQITKELLDDNSKAIKIILDARESLNSAYIKHLSPDNETHLVGCPFCGDIKESLSQLELEYEKQTDILTSINLTHLSHLEEIENDIFINLISLCGKRSKQFIDKYEKFVYLKPAISEINISKNRWLILRTTMEWLRDNNISFYHLIKNSKYEHIGSKKQLLRQEFINLLNNAKKSCDEDYTILVSSLNRLGLSKSKEGVINTENISIDTSDTQMSQHYMQYLIATYNTEEITTKIQEIHNLQTRENILNTKFKTISNIHRKYIQSIKSYEKEVAKSIAIPFFVYSSKILQTRSDGNGAHLKNAQTDRENGFLRFVSNVNDEHDAWNTMSSGQLSGLVISFMLAMNKVYPTNLSTILIDDPVHTMDDINFASFVELLRNEFHSSQIIISTHESKVASYFSSKYSKKGIVKTINMKQERLYSAN